MTNPKDRLPPVQPAHPSNEQPEQRQSTPQPSPMEGPGEGRSAEPATSGRLSTVKRDLLARRRGKDGRGIPRRRDAHAPVRATHQQQALWFLDRYLGAGTTSAYNLYHALRFRGTLDIDVLRVCVREIVARHDALRTTIVFTAPQGDDLEGVLELRVAPPPASDEQLLKVQDVRPDNVIESVLDEALAPFDLESGPLFRSLLLRAGPLDHVLLLVGHHAVLDGSSVQVIQDELAELYAAACAGRRDRLTPLPITFADWAAYVSAEEGRGAGTRRLDAAVARLEGAPALLEMPTDKPRAAEMDTDGGVVALRLDAHAAAALTERCRSEGVTLFTAVLAAYQVLLSRWSGQDDICVGIPVAGRSRADLDQLVGCFVSTGVVRAAINGRATFRQLLEAVAGAVNEARADAEVPFDQVVSRLRLDRAAGHNPVFQAFVDVTTATGAAVGWPGDLVVEQLAMPARQAKFDLSLSVTVEAGAVRAELGYRTALFHEATATALLDQLAVLLAAFAERPDVPLDEISALSDVEREKWWTDGSGAAVDVPDATLLDALDAASRTWPDAVAVRAGGDELTYKELDERATALARRLVASGTAPGDVVAVAIPRSILLPVALGAVLRAGAAYLPLDLEYPDARLRLVLEEARPTCVLTTSEGAAAFDGTNVVVLDATSLDPPGLLPLGIAVPALPRPHPDASAYVIYTSGSTGLPKGVEVPHRGIVNRLHWMQDAYGIELGERVLQKTPTTFDVSVWELFWPLIVGATVVFAGPGVHRDPRQLAQLVADEGITTVHFVPSMLRAFLAEPEAVSTRSCLRRVLCSGESLSASEVAHFAALLPGVELHNLYGPTEASVDVTAWRCGPNDAVATPPIGRPVWNTGARVLDDRLAPVPVGTAGQLYLSGVQLAIGYRRRTAMTAERFVADPWGPPGTRMYRTGDLVRRRADGALCFLGRVDHQVKLRGQRVELGEIEHVLLGDSTVAAAVVVVRYGHHDVAQLVAYVTGVSGEPRPDPEKLVERVRAVLPRVMVPEHITVLDSFPLTSAGKLDRRALPAPDVGISPAKRRLLARRAGSAAARPVADPRVAQLCGLISRLLGLDDVEPDDDFFRLGGDSIGSIRLISAARQAGLGLTERMVFDLRTPRALAAAATPIVSEPEGAATPDDDTSPLSLTPIMRWWRAGRGPTAGFYQSATLLFPPGTDATTPLALLTSLARRHEMLRAKLTTDIHGNEQLVVPLPAEVDVRRWLTYVDGNDSEEEQLKATAEVSRVDPVERMVNALWIDAGPDKPSRLMLTVHHLAVDGFSWRVLLEDIETAWEDAAEGRAPDLPSAGTSFRAWANHLRQEAFEPARSEELGVWRAVLSAPEPTQFRALNPATDTAGSARSFVSDLPGEHADAALNVVPERFRAGVDHVLLCALALAMQRWRGERGTPSAVVRVMLERHGRPDVSSRFDLSRTVGWFTVRHPAALDLTLARSPAEALQAVKEQLQALPDRGLGYGLLRYGTDDPSEALAGLGEPAVAFNYLGRFRLDEDPGAAAGVTLSTLGGGIADATPLDSALDVTAVALDGADGLRLRTTFTWAPGVLDEAAVRALLGHWEASLVELAELAADPTAGGPTAAELSIDIEQDELDALQFELESDLEE